MRKIKSFVASVMMLTMVGTAGTMAFPKKSEAGILFAAYASVPSYNQAGFALLAFTFIVAGVAYGSPGLLVLDESSSLKDALTVQIAKQLNTINDMNLVSEVATVVAEKYETQKSDASEVEVKLTDSELDQIIANSAEMLSADQMTQLRLVTQ